MSSPRPAVLFVCLGNICRSPLAEAAFRQAAQAAGLAAEADSAGTGGWHAGDPPDPRAQAAAMRHGMDIAHYRARQVQRQDFSRFTHIYALDHGNLRDLARIAPPRSPARLSLLLDVLPHRAGDAVADPYYGDEAGFETTWAEVSEAAAALVTLLARDIGKKGD